MKFMKLIIAIVFLTLIVQGSFTSLVSAQEDEQDEEQAAPIKSAGITSTKEYDGEEGVFVDYNSSIRIFWVRYFDKEDPDRHNTVTFFYDERTTVEYEEDIDIEDLLPGDKIKVYVRGKEDKTQHFNIVRTSEHIADRIVVVEKR